MTKLERDALAAVIWTRGLAATRPSLADFGAVPPVPLERLRRLTRQQQWDALIFLAGAVPDEVERALAAALTPLSTAGLAW